MQQAVDEARRVEALRTYGVLDTPPEPELDRLTALLGALCNTPIAFISLVDDARQWFKSVHGTDWTATDRAVAFCSHAIEQREVFQVKDARLDPRFTDNPLVRGTEQLRFYAGMPLISNAGHALGALAVVDRVPRHLDALQTQALQTLAGQVMVHLEARRHQRKLEDSLLQRARSELALRDSEGRWRMLFERNPLPMWVHDVETLRFVAVNDAAVMHYGWSAAEFMAMSIVDIRPPDDVPALLQALNEEPTGLHDARTWRHRRKNGELLWVDITAHSIELNGRAGRLILAHDVTDRVEALAAVRDSRARWERLFAASAIGIASAGTDLRWASANLAFCTLVARTLDEVVGQPVLAFTHADDVPECERALQKLASGELNSVTLEKRYLRPDGSAVWARASIKLAPPSAWPASAAAHDQSPPFERQFVAVVQDIDAQRSAEASLRQSSELLAMAGRLVGVGGWAVDLPHQGVRWSDELRLILDVPEGQIPSVEEAISWYSDASRPLIESALQACLEAGTAFDIDLDMRTQVGRALSVRVVGRAVRDASDRITGVNGALLDQTAAKAAQAALRVSEERFRIVASATADAVWDLDLLDDSIWWSDGLKTLFGHDPATLPPAVAASFDLIHPDDLTRVEESYRAVIAGDGKQWKNDYRFRRASGEYAFVTGRGYVIRDTSGRAVRMVGGVTDMTQHRALEAQLQQAQRLEAVGQLTGGIAHDFNNLLTVILGNAELLSEQLAERPSLQALAQMSFTAAERGAELTRRLLAFARKQPLAPQPVNAHRLLAGMDALLRRTLPENIDLELVRGAGLWLTLADAAQLESALLNLVLNARDAMPEGGKLTLETSNAWIDQDYADRHADVLPGQYVQFTVSDTGIGMTAAQLARAFEPFFTTKGVGKGSGLGLSMVYGYAKQSQGHLKLYSELGLGTTARLYLPRAAGMPEAAQVDESRRFASHVEPSLRGTATVLVVEDDDLVRRHAADSLAGLGYVVLVAANGAAALDLLQNREDVDLLFTDVVMPGGMNGRQLADAALALRPGLKVLYTSGYTENAIVHHGRLDAGVQLLPKPYRSIDLARKLRVVLGGESI